MPPKRGEGAAKGQIHEGNIELSVWSCWTAKLLLRAKVDAAKIDPKGKFISIDIDDDETAKPLFNTASSPSALIAAVEAEMTKKQADMKEIDDMIEEDGPDAERLQFKDLRQGNIDALSFVLNLLRSPPAEEVA